MAADQTRTLVEELQARQLLSAAQVEELKSPSSVQGLADELLRRGWFTAFQIDAILRGETDHLILGPYLLVDLVGEGGMGQVFKARHRLMKRDVAVKLIRPQYVADAAALARFQREIQALAQVAHPNVVLAYDADHIGERTFLVMEYVEGMALDKLVEKHGPLPVPLACDYVRQAALGLQHAHERGLVHRDIKPSNLLLAHAPGEPRPDATGWRAGGVVKVLDLGLALIRKPAADAATDADTLTSAHAVMGTPDFMAPEQALRSHQADIRADIYSLGCTLYFLLAGRPPFAKGTAMEKLMMHQNAQPLAIELLRPDVPRPLAALVAKMLAKRPEDRLQTPAEVAAALAPFCQGDLATPQVKDDRAAALPAFETLGKAAPTEPEHRLSATAAPRNTRLPYLIVAIALLVVIAGGAYWIINQHGNGEPDKDKPEPPAPAKKEPPTPAPPPLEFIVAADGKGTFTTIGDALKKATPRERIRVRPGTYEEALVIDRDVEIVGEGKPGAIVVLTRDTHCLVMNADSAAIRNLTFRGNANAPSKDEPKGDKIEHAAVKIPHGRLLLEDCVVTAATGPGVVIVGQTANPTLRRCEIHGNTRAGLGVHRGGQGNLENCRIHANQWGVAISEKGSPAIHNSRIHDNKEFGVFVFQQGEGRIDEGSVISKNRNGIAIQEEGSYLIVQRCLIENNPPCGVVITKGGKAKLFDCTILDNDVAGVLLSEKGTSAVIENCKIQKNKIGVGARQGAAGRVEDCDLRNNLAFPLVIDPGCDVIDRKNQTK